MTGTGDTDRNNACQQEKSIHFTVYLYAWGTILFSRTLTIPHFESERHACSLVFHNPLPQNDNTVVSIHSSEAMAPFVVGINHRTAPIAIREQVAFGLDELPHALTEFVNKVGAREVVILSTCNRTEIYSCIADPEVKRPIQWLTEYHGLSNGALDPYLFHHSHELAVRHLLKVACGLDSMILGEPQILGQLKSAYHTAIQVGTLGKRLNKLFQHAFSVAKQVRSDTAIGSSPVSVAFAAVRLAQQIFGDLREQTALLIGAGDTIELAAQHLHHHGLKRMIVANRSVERAQLIASRFGGYAIPLKAMPEHLAEADIVFASTASPHLILGKETVEQASRARKHRPIFMVDIAVPRDIDPAAGDLEDVYLYTVDDLHAVIQENLQSRRVAAHQADEIIDIATGRFMEWLNSLNAVATIQAMREQASLAREQVIKKGLQRLARGEDPVQVMEFLTRNLVNKLTHAPSVKLREASAAGRDELLGAARELFDLN